MMAAFANKKSLDVAGIGKFLVVESQAQLNNKTDLKAGHSHTAILTAINKS
jgi:hypothetical protein